MSEWAHAPLCRPAPAGPERLLLRLWYDVTRLSVPYRLDVIHAAGRHDDRARERLTPAVAHTEPHRVAGSPPSGISDAVPHT